MSNEVRVNPASLRALATAMTALPWMTPSGQAAPPDALPLAKSAVDNLNENARALVGFNRWAEAENKRIAEMLNNAADAYEKIDNEYKDKLDDPGRRAAIDAIPLPVPSTKLPQLPDAPSTPNALSASGYSDVKRTETDLGAGDHGNSLEAVRSEWTMAQGFVESHAAQSTAVDWEGRAADAAFARLSAFNDWLHQLSAAWGRLAHSAAKLRASHINAANSHHPIYARYIALEAQLAEAQGGAVNSIVRDLQELQRRSDEVREEYAKNATVDNVQVDDPPGGQRGLGGPAGSAGGSGGSGGVDRPTGDPEAMAARMGESLGGSPSAAGAKQAGGAPTGGGAPAGGGSPSGAGSAPGGGAPAGMPGGAPASGGPKLPTDPSLRPAAASGTGGGGGGGAGAGGGGRGMGAMPLSPAVTAETVAPAPTTPAATGAAAGTSPSGSVAGGAMGGMGMAPMAGAGAQQGKEKRRDPRLAPDEDLYTEDRPWTEPVIGNRRRRDVQEGLQKGKEAK